MNKNLKIGILIGIITCIIMSIIIIIISNNKLYTITFISNGGTTIENQIIKKGDKVVKPADPIRDGYKFGGWYLDGTRFYFNEEVTKSFKLRAKWLESDVELVTVTFDTDGGSKINNLEIVKGEKITKPTDPIKDGYVFIEWLLNNDKFNFNSEIVSDINLVASWKELEEDMFTITFDSKGGSSIATQILKKDEKVIEPAEPVRDGYKFNGWYLNNKKFDFNTNLKENITLTAKWTLVPVDNQTSNDIQPNTPPEEEKPQVVKHVVTFDSDGGETVNSIEVEENTTIANLPTTKKKNYEFKGWYLNETLFTTTTPVSSNIILKAQYTFLDSEKQMNDGYPKPDIAYSYSTAESGQKYLDLLNSLWNTEVVPRLNKGFYSQEEIDTYLEWLDNKAYEYKNVLECLPENEYMCE